MGQSMPYPTLWLHLLIHSGPLDFFLVCFREPARAKANYQVSCTLDGVGEARSRGGSCWEILNYIFIKKTVLVVGEDLVYFSL